MQIWEQSSYEKQKKALRFWDRECAMTENDVWKWSMEQGRWKGILWEALEEKTNK